jgi:hypothetical protein
MQGGWQDRLLAAAYRFRLRTRYSGKPQLTQRISNPWHAVSIVPGESACEAVGKWRDQRVLSAQAPQLPLAECAHPGQCTCRYRHHADRRSERRRARDNGLPKGSYAGGERRSGARGRRATDGWDTYF